MTSQPPIELVESVDPIQVPRRVALVRPDIRPAVRQREERWVMTFPHLIAREVILLQVVVIALALAALLFDAPLEGIANPLETPNPAKAPWYFLGLQELVSYSAFSGGVLVPAIALLGLVLIPYLDRESGDEGVWFSGPAGRRVTLTSAAFALSVTVGVLALLVRYGWLRQWFPDVPQIVILAFNPGTLYALVFALWSLFVLRRHGSTRLAAVALFTCFLVGFGILTYVGAVHRGPNWGFYWRQADWPVH